uniref:Phospholipid/glycerol acyltransferase domain-containing protein n=1 Tax=Strongyloides stercoralis TaxID=6248 RepID=A0AAF5I3P2_STRER
MLNFFLTILTYYGYLILTIVGIVIFLSSLGLSSGTREYGVTLLCQLFEWVAEGTDSVDNLNEDDFVTNEDNDPFKNDEYYISNKDNLHRRRSSSTEKKIIERDASESVKSKLDNDDNSGLIPKNKTGRTIISDSLEFITAGFESIIEDEVTSRFKAETLVSWNLLSRTKSNYIHINWKVSLFWVLGWITRYTILLHIRLSIFFVGLFLLIVSTALIGFIPHGKFKRWLNRRVMLMCMRIFSRSFSSIIRFHDSQNKAKGGGICVANHTSPIDVMILSCDNCYAMIGQSQGGFLGFLQKTLSRSTHHIWFERSEAKDRLAVVRRMQEHVNDPKKLPILIFPEGTCINNTSVMQFKKGSFEIASVIYPIAMKYDARLGDAFWNSSLQGYGQYLWMMMTSWAIICNVWYLPPMTKNEGEDAIEFARRVKKAIAIKGGLVDLEWDGQLKRTKVSNKLINEHRKKYYDHLERRTSISYYKPIRLRKISQSTALSQNALSEELINETQYEKRELILEDNSEETPDNYNEVKSRNSKIQQAKVLAV